MGLYLSLMNKLKPEPTTYLRVDVKETEESSRRIKVLNGRDPVTGKFWFTINITAVSKDVYIPLSIASGKKPTGFVYQIEGTVQGFIVTTDISSKGEGITQITLGTIVYCKIPAGKTATFRIRVEIRGELGKSYRVAMRQIHFKLDPGDARYLKSPQDLHTKMLKFE